MRKKLLFALLATTTLSFAQNIQGYYGYINDVIWTTDGTGTRSYTRMASSAPLDHSATGANQTWNFTDLTSIGSSNYHNLAPTDAQMAIYPGTTRVVQNSVTINNVTTVSNALLNNWAITGVENADFTVNYTDNGGFSTVTAPDYGYTHTESIAGTYLYDGYDGTFTGTITGTVDAYGTLNLDNEGFGQTTDAVTRLKIVQSLSLQYPGFGTVGTAVFTSYHYYRAGDLYPYFTSTTSDFNIPLLSIDEEQTILEAAFPVILDTPSFHVSTIAIAPNPVKNTLQIQADDSIELHAVTVTDINGRTVLTQSPINNTIDVSELNNGVYFARIDSDSGSITKKIIKQ
jgi:hypothetical protein